MSIDLQLPNLTELKPRITVIGVGGGGGNAVNNMIASGLDGVRFVVANTDAQALVSSSAEHRVQLGVNVTEGLGAGSRPEIGEAAAEEALDEIRSHISGSHMVFVAAGMGGGTGTGAISVIARVAKEMGILVVGVVTKPFQFEGSRRTRIAEAGIAELRQYVDTLIVIPNQNLFRIADERTTFAEAFILADQVLYSGIACIVDLIVKDGLINLDFADVRTVMSGMGAAMMGTGEASGENRAVAAAEEAIANPLLDDMSLRGARGLLLSIIGGSDLTLYEVDEAASRVREEVDPDANIIVGATFDDTLGDRVRVSIVASGMSGSSVPASQPNVQAHQQTSMAAAAPAAVAQRAEAPPAEIPVVAQVTPGQDVQRQRLSEKLSGFLSKTSQEAQEEGPGVIPPQPTVVHEDEDDWGHGEEVIIEDRPPQLIPEANSESGFGLHAHAAQAAQIAEAAAPAFVPAAPHAVPRRPNQMPPLSEFPAVGQREYQARVAGAQEAAAHPPSQSAQATIPSRGAPATSASASDAQPLRKRGFFERLTGRKRPEDIHSKFAQPQMQPRANPSEHGQAQPQRPQTDVDEAQHGRQSIELPMFFEKKRGSR